MRWITLTRTEAYAETLKNINNLSIVNDIKYAINNAIDNYEFKTTVKLPFKSTDNRAKAIYKLFISLGYSVILNKRDITISWE